MDAALQRRGERSINVGRVMVTMQDVDSVSIQQLGDAEGQRRMEAGRPPQCDDGNAAVDQLRRPLARLVETAHHRLDRGREATAKLNDEPLRAARRKTKDELHHATASHDELRKPSLCHKVPKTCRSFPRASIRRLLGQKSWTINRDNWRI